MKTEKMEGLKTQKLQGLELIKANKNVVVEDPYCGPLRISLANEQIPGSGSEVVALGLKSTQGHVHKTFSESYWVVQGSLTVVTHDSRTDTVAKHTLHQFDRLLIHPEIAHKVIDGSADNMVVVRSFPLWVQGDEVRSEKLEREFGADAVRQKFNLSEVELEKSLRKLVTKEYRQRKPAEKADYTDYDLGWPS